MGDHVCAPPQAGGGGGAAAAPKAALAPEDTFMPLGRSVHDKIGAIPPVDTAIASALNILYPPASRLHHADPLRTDRSYSRQPLTPMSLSSGSRSVSPRTPGARPSIGRADEYFSPTIAQNDEQAMPQPTRPGGYGGFGDDSQPAYQATSPKKPGLSLLTRIDSIAAGPYAQDMDSSPPPMSSVKSSPPRRPARTGEESGYGAAPPRMPRKNGYGGFGPPKREDQPGSFGALNRAETFAASRSAEKLDALEPPLRAPSAPGPRPDRLRDTSRLPPPRTSLTPAVKKSSVNLDAEFGVNNPYHSPSASSVSSTSRGSSQASHLSSATSPTQSAHSPRKPSDGDSLFNSLINDVQSSMAELKPKELPSTPDLGAPASPEMRKPPTSSDGYDPAVQGGRPPSPPQSQWDRTDRQDPAVQGGTRNAPSKRLPPSPTEAPDRRAPAPRKSRGNCKACGLAITGKSVSSADGRLTGRYHKACFVCTSCSAPFETAEFYVHKDRPFCQFHYHKENGSLCGSCSTGIEGQYLEDEGYTKYHVSCFRCGDCQMVLRDGYFDVNGRAYCERDAWRRLQQSSRRSPSMSSQRSYGSSPLAPPGRSGMRPPPGGLPSRPMDGPNGRMGGPPPPRGPGMGLAPPMAKMEKRRTRLGMMGPAF